jgi:lambda family phage portal protein
MDFVKAQELIIETTARDGECLVLFRCGPEFGPFQFQIQILEGDNLDHMDRETTNVRRKGNEITQGVEINAYGKPIAYHVFKYNPNDERHPQERQRIPAEDIIHLYNVERPGRRRGFSWLASAMITLHHINKYREAELEYARIACAKQVFYKMAAADGFIGDEEIDAMQNVSREMPPGAMDMLPPGVDIASVDWESPNSNLAEFQKPVLRGVAASLGVSYHAFASDLESVNYSSARFGARADHHQYQSLQNWFVNNCLSRIYHEWLKVQLMSTNILPQLSTTPYDKCCKVKWTPRGWESIDPQKDSRANIANLAARLTTRTQICQKNRQRACMVLVHNSQEWLPRFSRTTH